MKRNTFSQWPIRNVQRGNETHMSFSERCVISICHNCNEYKSAVKCAFSFTNFFLHIDPNRHNSRYSLPCIYTQTMYVCGKRKSDFDGHLFSITWSNASIHFVRASSQPVKLYALLINENGQTGKQAKHTNQTRLKHTKPFIFA